MPRIYCPVKPYGLNQAFGSNAAYYAKFNYKGHPGWDLAAPHATPLYAPVSGQAHYKEDSHGGAGIYIRTTDGGTWFNIILWHLCTKTDPQFKPLIRTDGQEQSVEIGQLIGYTDNSGAPYESSGDHLHLGVQPCDADGNALYYSNGYDGCVDPLPYFDIKDFAQDIPQMTQIVETASKVVQNIADSNIPSSTKSSLLSKVADALKNLFSWLS